MADTNYIQQFMDLLNSGAAAQPQDQVTPSSDVLNSFFNLPQYQLLYGENANQSDPTQRFQHDPGFQYNMDEALKQVQHASAAKGLLESGTTQRDLLTTAQGLQNQGYQTWMNQQSNLFNNYQQQLQGLAGMGQQESNLNATDATNLGSLLGTTLGGYNMSTGQNQAQSTLGVGENISSLLANLGVLNSNAILNTGAAQANALMQGAGMQMQQQNAQMASNAQSQSSNMNGVGSLLGAQALQGQGSNPWRF